jgi:N-acetylglucosamine-6-phosphate deacetylase
VTAASSAPARVRFEGPLVTGGAGESPLLDGAVAIEGERVVGVGRAAEVPRCPGEQVVTAPPEGLIGPGLVDLLVYGGGGAQVADAEPEAIAEVAATHARHGTTGLLLGIESCDETLAVRRLLAIRKAVEAGLCPSVAGVHLEGPFLHPVRRGIHPLAALRPPDGGLLDRLLEAGGGLVRVVTLAPELPGALALVESLLERGVAVSQGHSQATYEQAADGARAGARLCTHLFNAMPPLLHREPGLPGLFLVPPPGLPSLTATLIADGAHVAPPVVQLAAQLLGPGRLALLSDATAPAGLPAGTPIPAGAFGGRDVVVVDGAPRARDDGTLAGSVLLLKTAVVNLRRWTGWPLHDCVAAASAVPSRAAGLLGEGRGQLCVGGRADLVVWGAGGALVESWVAGRRIEPI